MTAFKPAYRLRMYAPRSVDATEATVLVPAAGAPHSDAFQVASIAGVSGYQPYLQSDVRGRNGRIDLKSRKIDIGNYAIRLIDKRLPDSDNLTRWWSAFWGDVKGRPLGKLKVEVDESLDGGASWTLLHTLELIGSRVVAKNEIALSTRDRAETLKMRTFVGQPHASLTYVARPTLLPIGFRGSSYGKSPATPPLTGTTANILAGSFYLPTGERGVYLDAPSRAHDLNIVTQNLRAVAPPVSLGAGVPDPGGVPVLTILYPQFTTTLRCHLKQTSGGASGTEGDYKVGAIGFLQTQRTGLAPHYQVHAFALKELPSTDVGYAAVPAAGVTCEIAFYNDGEVSPERPLLINDVDPAQYIQDLCAGLFSDMYRPPQTLPSGKSYGDPKRVIVTNGVSALEGTRPPMRLVPTAPSTVKAEIERVCFENDWVPWLDAQGRLNIIDLAIPTSFGAVGSITQADHVAEDDPNWEHDPTAAIQLVKTSIIVERIISPPEIWQSQDEFPELKGYGGVEETRHWLEALYIGSVDFGEEVLEIDTRGYRFMDGEVYQDQPRSTYYQARLLELANAFARPFGYGLTTIPLRCRRTAATNAVTPGGLALLDVDAIPDPGTHKRGGSQLCRVLEKTPNGAEYDIRLAFLASATVAAAPTLAQPAQESGNTSTGATTVITVNAQGHPVQVRYAITDTATGSPPADNSPLWTVAGIQRGNGTFTLHGLWPGKRVWVQGRSFPLEETLAYVPSAWTLASGNGRVDMAALATPSSLAASSVTDKTALLTWTNGDSQFPVEVLLMTPVGDPRVRIEILSPSTTHYSLRNLSPSTSYRAEVRHVLGEFYGAGDTEDFTTAASGAATAPALISHTIVT